MPSNVLTQSRFLPPWPWSGLGLIAIALTGLFPSSAQAQTAYNPSIQVGIVQRFGKERSDRITLEPAGGQLTLQFEGNGGNQTVATTEPVQIEVVPQPLAQPEQVERVVLSTHRSFESAEDSANYWKAQGLDVEIAQPRQWQVWAKRETYSTPLLRRLLLQNVQAQGGRTVFLDSQIRREVPLAGFVVNGTRVVADQVAIAPSNNRVYVNEINSSEGRQLFAGSLRLQPNAYGTYTLVNTVDIETYLRGVVPFEIGSGAPNSAIEAQAILARTYALRNLRRFTIDNYQLCADTQCQVYRGLSGAATSTDRAIAATQGQVLTYQNELVDALYSSTSGGVTAAFSNVWNGPDRPYLRPRIDAVQNVWDLQTRPLSDEANLRAFLNLQEGFNETGRDLFRWREASDVAQITADIKEYLSTKQHPLANLSRVEQLRVAERSSGGRVQQIEVVTDRGSVILEKDEVLRALSAPRSTLFYLDPVYEVLPSSPSPAPSPVSVAPSPPVANASSEVAQGEVPALPAPAASPSPTPTRILKGYTFVGGGWGHAVGLSQYGAMNLGRLNWPASRILEFYFPGATVQPLSERTVLWREPE
ncbi:MULTISPECIES: SpoIID/LytB domain-containing protein [unclassified Leptolyngbya]|uniref:SpoIID/LytB domain-containing protein n=1 Tax=unclassified Leptolyngbya TaxID=2650499 RepID=UPI0016820532|nr:MULTISPECIES: SpoIID/LytB domain-containing protein [unclassified Leptolyngbya]MBD1911351.1 SpoIID/LytB domain-containing protein [Leptolyngbya sp. FACHB-8]MBD2156631.1 SpoIID/LytB domain-containing protein [Leptolyngbya sp. FACHB-16]